MSETKTKKTGIGVRKWWVIILVGLVGQFAWAVENMYLNTYITYLNFTAPQGQSFDYSLMIAITTALSAIVAALTTLFMGGLTDKVNKRKIFISVGYIIWGVATASFGLLNVTSANEILPISMTASTAAIMVIVIDCIMTFFGSTANDAAFNSYITKNVDDKNRAKVEGVIEILPLIAMLVIFVGLNGLTTEEGGYHWDLFFYIIGGIVLIVGVISLFLIPKEDKVAKENNKYSRILIEGFKPSTIKNNRILYITLLIYFIYGVAIQVYFPYLMVYIERTCSISNSGSSFLTPFAIVMAVALLLGSLGSVLLGILADKKGKFKMIIPSFFILMVGLLMMFFIKFISNDTGRTIYAALSGLIMILGYVGIPTIINSIVREYIPKGKEGAFMGVRMIFVVALPMCIGPFIGNALNNTYGDTYTGTFGEESIVPSEWGYIAAIGIILLALIPIYFLFREIKKQNKGKNTGYLVANLKHVDVNKDEVHLIEYPRPNFVRKSFMNLNGIWKGAISKNTEVSEYNLDINVPYAVESPLSNVNHLLNPDEFIYYSKDVTLSDEMFNKAHVILHFDGVDQTADIYINDEKVLTHIGGYTKFEIDIKKYLKSPKFNIKVRVSDVTDESYHLRGKQQLHPSGWFYSSSSGIYKAVWIEGLEENYIISARFTPLFDEGSVSALIKTSGKENKVLIEIEGKSLEIEANQEVKIKINNPIPWDLDNPYLYKVKIKYDKDEVESYFGLRKIESRKLKDGGGIYLNNKRIILNGLLDQGYYDLGGLTPSSYQDYYNDIKNIKDLGYNCLRKHIKTENDMFYYYCDLLGVLVIQDFPCGGTHYKFLNVVFPRISIKLFNKEKYCTYERYGRLDEEGRKNFEKEVYQIMDETYNFPSIIMYTIFNEAWGEFEPSRFYKILKKYDPTRLFDTASGWLDTPESDIYSIHSYTIPARRRLDKINHRPYVLTEIGGTSLKVKDHYDYPAVFGHGVCKTTAKLNKKYAKLYSKLLKHMEAKELNGVIYTELNDCETECNGIYTLDRKVLKLDPNLVKEINKKIENIK